MPKLVNIKSKLKEPIRFFLNYPRIDRNSLYLRYKELNEYDRYFDKDKNVAFIKVETRIDEDEVDTSFEEFKFEDFIKGRIFDEEQISQALITKFYRRYPGKSENEFAYKKLLRAFIENFERLKNYPHYPESELLSAGLIKIIKFAMYKYRRMFNDPLEKQVERIIKGEERVSGNTGFILKDEFHSKTTELNRLLISATLIHEDNQTAQWQRFFAGRYPHRQINWIGEPSHLKYFIDKVCDNLIKYPPKQRYRFLSKIFRLKDQELESKFYKNHNYIGKNGKEKIDLILDVLFS